MVNSEELINLAFRDEEIRQRLLQEQKVIEKREESLHCFLAMEQDFWSGKRKICCTEKETLSKEETEERFPLFGMTLGIKDNLCLKGMPATCGSEMLKNYLPPYTATAVQRVMDAGALVVGKTNMDEFAMGSSTENSAFGITRNPWNEDFVPGGSSGGSAAAVASGMVQAALGTDTGGSVRLPAAFCGVVGLKPTYGKISRYGLISYASSMDQIGTLTTNVSDAAKLLAVMEGYDNMDGSMGGNPGRKADDGVSERKEDETKTGSGKEQGCNPSAKRIKRYQREMEKGVAGLRIGLPGAWFSEGLSPEVERAVHAAAKSYRAAGAIVEEVELPLTEYAVAAYYVLSSAQASSNLLRYQGVLYGNRVQGSEKLQEMFALTREQFLGKEVKRRILLGTFVLGNGYYEDYYLEAERVRRMICESYEKIFTGYDLLLGPTAPTTAWPLGGKLKNPMEMYLADVYTVSANLTGLPAISIPCGVGKGNLPIGMQLIAPKNREDLLLRAGFAWEKQKGGYSLDYYKSRI